MIFQIHSIIGYEPMCKYQGQVHHFEDIDLGFNDELHHFIGENWARDTTGRGYRLSPLEEGVVIFVVVRPD